MDLKRSYAAKLIRRALIAFITLSSCGCGSSPQGQLAGMSEGGDYTFVLLSDEGGQHHESLRGR